MEDEQIPAETVEQPKRKGGRPRGSKKAQPEAAFSKDEVKEFLTSAISEMKKPTDLEQAKIDEDNRRRLRLARASAEAARREQAETNARVAACQHRREDDKHTFGAQIMSNGFIYGRCLRCEFEFGPIEATQAQRDAGAVNLHLISDLTADQLTRWTEATRSKHPELLRLRPAWAVA
jgi:hypothetical protein